MLCICMNVIIIGIIMIYELGIYTGEYYEKPIVTNQHLRGMFVEDIADEIFTNIYDGVIGAKIKGKMAGYFTIMCITQDNNKYNYGDDNHYNCDVYDGYTQWWGLKSLKNGGDVLIPDNIQKEKIIKNVLDKAHNAFQDSNITKDNKNCCVRYRITWLVR